MELDKSEKEKTSKPKLLILTHHDVISGSGGDIARVKKIADLLSDSCAIKLFGFRYLSSIYFSRKRPLLFFLMPFWISMLVRQIARTNWDFVYCYNQRYIVIFVRLLRSLLFKKYRIFYDAVLTWELLPTSKAFKRFRSAVEHLAGRCADSVIVVSELSKIFFSSKSPLLIPTLVNTDIFKPEGKGKKLKVRASYGIAETDTVIGVTGPFNSDYNRPLLMFLQENMEKFDQRIKFMIIGKSNEKGRVKYKNIIYTGLVNNYIDHLSALDGVLIIRKIPTDGAINRIVEAMAMGLPVFANPTAGKTMDYATPRKDFFIFEEEKLPDKISEVIFDRELVTEVSKNARDIAEKYYSEGKHKQKLLSMLWRYVQPSTLYLEREKD